MFLDFAAAIIAWNIFYYLRKNILNEEQEVFQFVIRSIPIGCFWIALYAIHGFYVDSLRKSRVKEVFILLIASLIGTVILFFALLLDDVGVMTYKSYYRTGSTLLFTHYIISLTVKLISLSYVKRLIAKGKLQFNTLIVGSNQNAIGIVNDLKKINYSLGLNFIAYLHAFEDSKDLLKITNLKHLGGLSVIEKVIARCKIEEVIIAVEPKETEVISEILHRINDNKLKVSIVPNLYHMLIGTVKVNHVFGVPLIHVRQTLMPVWQQVIKRVFDIGFSLAFLLIGAPVYIFTAIMVKLSSKGPVFYTQERIGKNGVPFNIIKFRSMYTDSEAKGPALSSDHDPRITPWGRFMRKTRLDELPQFVNVVIGDMSVVGPRPERQFFIDQIVEKAPYYRHLLKVRPGITSLGQVKYGYAENVEEMVRRLKYDILYIENMTLAMDFRIMLFTVLIVIQGRGK